MPRHLTGSKSQRHETASMNRSAACLQTQQISPSDSPPSNIDNGRTHGIRHSAVGIHLSRVVPWTRANESDPSMFSPCAPSRPPRSGCGGLRRQPRPQQKRGRLESALGRNAHPARPSLQQPALVWGFPAKRSWVQIRFSGFLNVLVDLVERKKKQKFPAVAFTEPFHPCNYPSTVIDQSDTTERRRIALAHALNELFVVDPLGPVEERGASASPNRAFTLTLTATAIC